MLRRSDIYCIISVETMREIMHKIIEEFLHLFAKEPSALEQFLNSRSLKTHADVEFWTRYFENKGNVL